MQDHDQNQKHTDDSLLHDSFLQKFFRKANAASSAREDLSSHRLYMQKATTIEPKSHCRGRFSTYKSRQTLYAQRPDGKESFSSSPDSRIHSAHTAFSGSSPMTDFRHVCSLRVYSGGTARDLHPVLYSPPGPEGIQAALKPIHFSFLSLYPPE